ncbi:MAG: Threonine dehydratase [Candidatus Uhrbacteria bacterium GW2011_GWF2_44_350]|uniref:Threonine dehydratase n=1 Tax=Candidatus Uhrbacteria bacterium GW2011_GWF2_44_350 TaxID=1619000 RepID=A0A0G1JEA3_9BACT|nr:MAG: Threonine dehydratase [Candidatus Uhrbacteria bacterium GW2011_GWF2_44_350]
MLTLKDTQKARKNIQDLIIKTPIVPFSKNIFLKLENRQPVVNGFKIRGAANYMVSKNKENKSVITSALGTHGFAVGYVGKKLGIETTCFMPNNSPEVAIKKMKKLVDHIILTGDVFTKTEIAAEKFAKSKKTPFIHPYNDPMVIAGQGTIGLEILEQLPEVKNVYVPISGGGLASGIGLAIKSIDPKIKIIGVQPSAIHAMQTAISKGRITTVKNKKTLAEKLAINLNLKTQTFNLIKKYVDSFILVDEKDIRKAIKNIYQKTGEITEGSGAITLAAALKDKKRKGLSVCVISGGNIDKEKFKKIVGEK